MSDTETFSDTQRFFVSALPGSAVVESRSLLTVTWAAERLANKWSRMQFLERRDDHIEQSVQARLVW